jgi:hypothetical protein
MPRKLTTFEFIDKSIQIHGDKYDYSETKYNGSRNKITIICKKHGNFTQTAYDHLSGCGCPECNPTKRLGGDKFIEKSKIIHGNKYDYSNAVYGDNNYIPVEIICKHHGSFTQRPWAHLRGQGCPGCSNNKMLTQEEFILKCKIKHGDKYDYSLTEYNGRRKYINIICRNHGVFTQLSRLHLDGSGCNKCNNSKLEEYLSNELFKIKEPFEKGKKFKDCRNKKPLPFDFYLPLRNTLIECDGIQHSEIVEHFGGEDRFNYQKNNDDIKTKWCLERQIKLVRLKNNSEIDEYIKYIKSEKILFDKLSIKDISIDRIKPTKIESNYLIKTDFNWYKNINIKFEIELFIKTLKYDYKTNDEFDFIIENNYIILIDNFRDCEINKDKNWISKLKDELEESDKNLIIIYPEDWVSKKEIVKSRISNILKCNQFRIGSRKCQIVIPDNKSASEFLKENHIKGNINSSIKIALKYKDEIVSLMTFGSLRRNLGQKSKEGSYELLRFCNKKGYTVIGSANKLMKYFKNKYNPNYIVSYADRCWSSIHKNIYQEMCFNFVGKTPPSYSYLVGDNKYGRYKYRKDKLVEFGYDKGGWTEKSICSSNLIFKMYDAGCLKYELNLQNTIHT